MEKQEINLLHLAPRIPFPADDGGKIGIFNSLRYFKKFNISNTFVFFSDEEVRKDYLDELKKYADVYIFNHSTKNTALRIAKSLINNESIYITKHNSPEFIEFLKEIIKRKKINFTYADHTCMAYSLDILRKEIGLNYSIKLNNVEWMIWKRYADNIPFYNPKKYYIGIQSKLLKREEARLLKNSLVSFAITDNDFNRAKELAPENNLVMVPTGVNLDEWKIDESIIKNQNELIIATTYHWVHNIDAVRWFIENVMPALITKVPNIKFTMLGKNMPDWMRNLDKKNFNPVGYVDEIQTFLNKATIYVAPLFVGSGVRIKILEAMAMGLPVVATDISAEGIKAGENEGLFRANNPTDFANKIDFLLKNKDLRYELGQKARKFIELNHSWDTHTKIIIEEISKFI